MSFARLMTAHFIDHKSEATHYVHPYLFTRDSESTSKVYVWTVVEGAPVPELYATLEEAMVDPTEHHLIGTNCLLSVAMVSSGYRLSEILIHSLPDGHIRDRVAVGPVDSSGPTSNSKFLGVNNGNIAVWRNGARGGGMGVVEIYILSADSEELVLTSILLPPPESETLESLARPGEFYPPDAIHISQMEVIAVRTGISLSNNIEVTRWAQELAPDRRALATFPFSNPSCDSEMRSTLCYHIHIQSQKTLMMAHYECPEEDYDPDYTSTVRCLDITTLALRWSVTLNQVIMKVRHSAHLDILIVVGLSSLKSEHRDSLVISILDPSTGAAHATHIVKVPEKPCGKILYNENGIAVDLTASGEEAVIVFGDGQSNVVPIEDFVSNGFPTVDDGSARTATTPFPAIGASVPSNAEENEDVQNENWRWIKCVHFGDKAVYLQSLRSHGFAVLSWE